jgi:putative PIN family toxin of toxin-antitoxin system
VIRAVLDINTLVSGTITPVGPAGVILQEWRAGAFTLVTCEELLVEYGDVLLRPKILRTYRGITRGTVTASATALRAFSDVVALPDPIPPVIPEDPDDDLVLACAVAGRADYVVTGDRRHLLPLREYLGIPIVSPGAFVSLVRS